MVRRFVSLHSEIISDHRSVLHDETDTLELGDVGDGIARYRDQISEFSRFDGANLVLPPQHLGGTGWARQFQRCLGGNLNNFVVS